MVKSYQIFGGSVIVYTVKTYYIYGVYYAYGQNLLHLGLRYVLHLWIIITFMRYTHFNAALSTVEPTITKLGFPLVFLPSCT